MPQIQNKQKGITMTSLVVTIIILIILATASISIVFGERGIMPEATETQNEIQQNLDASEAFIRDTEQEYLNAMYISP